VSNLNDFRHHGLHVPEHLHNAIRAYIDNHRVPGDFLQAVICNNLMNAASRADSQSLPNLLAIVSYFYNEAPGNCWGSKEQMEWWASLPVRRALWDRYETYFIDQDYDEDVLDEYVHETKSQEGSDTNNEGLEGQFNYLFTQLGADWVERELFKVNTYKGKRIPGRCIVIAPDGQQLDPRTDLVNHSPSGFEWGFAGSGPAQLALALLSHFTGDDAFALDHYQQFKAEVVQHINKDAWTLTAADMREAVEKLTDAAKDQT
jgi:hypothetical protein